MQCAADEDCPEGFFCRIALERCVPTEFLDDAPPALDGAPILTPTIGRTGTIFEFRFVATERLGLDPVVYVEAGARRLDFAIREEGTVRAARQYVYAYAVDGTEGEGSYSIRVDLVDENGSEVRGLRVAGLALDLTAPAIVPDTVSVVLLPGEENLLPRPATVTVGTIVRVGLGVSEPLARPPTLLTRTPEVHAFEPAGQVGTIYTFELTFDEPEHEQGPYTLELTAEDAAGNVAILPVELPLPGLVLDTEPPRPPDTDTAGRIIYQRIPWGSDETLGNPALRLAGGAGAAPGGATILVFSAAAPPWLELGRATARADGSFDSFDLVPADRAKVWAVLADEAGNLSEASLVRDGELVVTLGFKEPGSTLANPHELLARSWMTETLFDAGRTGSPELAGAVLSRTDGALASSTGTGRWLDRTGGAAPAGRSASAAAFDAVRGKLVLFGGRTAAADSGELWEWDGSRWRRQQPSDPESDGGPSRGSLASLFFDEVRGRPLLFGGYLGRVARDDTWEWDGKSWRRLQVPDPEGDGNPLPRFDQAITYDRARRVAVLFGGETTGSCGGSPYCSDTWEWNSTSWIRRGPTDPEGDGNPQPRRSPRLAYDVRRERTVLFGGLYPADCPDGTAACGTTWEWDGTSWRRFFPTDPEGDGNPARRTGHALAWDPIREKVLLFGGEAQSDCGGGSPSCGDLWEWDGASWRRITPTDPELDGDPPGRSNHTFTLDSGRQRLVLTGGKRTGGCGPAGDQCADSWEWDGTSFRLVSPTDRSGDGEPRERASLGLAYDATRRRALLFGGEAAVDCGDGEPACSDTWAWDGTEWVKQLPTDPEGDGNPSARFALGLVHAPSLGEVVLFAGATFGDCGAGTSDCSDTWQWNGTSWHRMIPTDPEGDGDPPGRFGAQLAYDPDSGTVLLFGGSKRGGCDEGGEDCTGLWEWNGASWRKLVPTDPEGDGNPPGRVQGGLAFDVRRGRLVLFGGHHQPDCGGSEYCDDLWEWNGTSWERRIPADPEGDGNPGARLGHSLTYDPDGGRMILVGGIHPEGCGAASTFCSEAWAWDGLSFRRLAPADPEDDGAPLELFGAAATWDGLHHRELLFGGADSLGCDADAVECAATWELDPGAEARPGMTLRVALASLGLPTGSTLLRGETSWVAGGDGQLRGVQIPGVELLGFSDAGWRPLAQAVFPSAAPGAVSFSTTDVVELSRLISVDGVGLSVVPLGFNGTGTARVTVDYAELRLGYRLPPE